MESVLPLIFISSLSNIQCIAGDLQTAFPKAWHEQINSGIAGLPTCSSVIRLASSPFTFGNPDACGSG